MTDIDRGLDLLGYDELGNYRRRGRRTKPNPPIPPIVRELAARRLRPIVDPALELVRADCPDCRAGDGIYRPLAVIPHQGRVIVRCDICGERHE